MIFKPKEKSKAKQKVRARLIRAPILMILALACLVGHPARADAEETTLYENMPGFVTIGEYDIIETSGKNLNMMFDIKDHNKTVLNENRQYIAYYKLDKLKTSSTSWSTYYNYWHTGKWGESVPTLDTAKSKAGYIFGYQVKDTSNSQHIPNVGKKTFYNFKKNVNETHRSNIGRSSDGYKQVGTLHYFSVDPDTVTGKKLAEVMEKNPEKDYVEFYISPIIMKNNGTMYYTCRSWYNAGWNDRVYKHYSDHYDQMVRLKLPHVKVTSTARLIGSQKSSSDSMKYQVDLSASSSNSHKVLPIEKSDYLWAPEGDPLTATNNKPLQRVKYVPFSEKSFSITNAGTLTGTTSGFVMEYDADSEKVFNYMCVGYRIVKTAKVNGETKKIYLASTMIEMHKDASGEYVPYFVSEKDGSDTEVDEVSGQALSQAKTIYDQKVTVKRYDKYDVVTKHGKSAPDKLYRFEKGQKVKLGTWIKDISKDIKWVANDNWGIRSEDDDLTTEINVDWYYAKVSLDDTSNHKVTLDTYYTSNEDFNLDTKEFPSVDDSRDLEYNHDSAASKSKSKLIDSSIIAKVSEGAPWVSYSVERDNLGAYELKDGTKIPKKSSSLHLKSTGSKSTKFKNTKPVKQISKSDLKNICYKNKAGETLAGMTTPSIPYIVKQNKKDSFKSSCNNYLYKVVVRTAKDDVWTEFTAEDIWGSQTPANGKIVKNKSTNRSYTTYAPFMRNYIYTTYGTPGMIKAKDSDWEKDAFAMTHFIIP